MTVQLHDLREERERKRQIRKAAFEEIRKPRTPLQEVVQMAATNSLHKSRLNIETLERLDRVLTVAESMALDWPKDAYYIADGLLRACLRLAWVRVSGKPLSDPEPDRVAMKMFQKGAIDKVTMRRITAALKSKNPVIVLDVCRGLLVFMSKDA